MKKIEIGANEKEQRLDKFLKKYLPKAGLSYIYKIIRKDIKVNGKRCKEDYMLKEGDELSLYIDDESLKKMSKNPRKKGSSKRQFKVAYEDENIIIVDKPFGLLTHGDSKEKKNHLANQVVDYLIEKGDYVPRLEKTFVPAPINRLDRNTTGLVIFGKNASALKELNKMIGKKDLIEKTYSTIVSGEIKSDIALSDYLVKDEKSNMVKVLSQGQCNKVENSHLKNIETLVEPVKYNKGYTLVKVLILTGRSHQIRAHLASIGHPLIGDQKYGNSKVNREMKKRFSLGTQLLHAYKLRFKDIKGELAYLSGLEVTSKVSDEFQKIEKSLFGVTK